MPVSRLTNVADFNTLLDEIRNFLDATGDWAIHVDMATPTEGPLAGGYELVMSNDDVLVGLRSTDTGAGANRLYMFDGIPPYTGTVDLDSLPNNSGVLLTAANYTSATDVNARQIQPAFAGPFPTVTMFTDDPSTYCHVVIEVASSRFRHLAFGNMRKFGSWTGGAYYAMTHWVQNTTFIDNPAYSLHIGLFEGQGSQVGNQSTFHYEGDPTYKWRAVTQTTLNSVARRSGVGSTRSGFGHMFSSIQESPFSGLIALQPVTLWAINTLDTPDTTRPVGQVKDVAQLNIRNLEPGESYFIGSDEWIAFPMSKKGVPSDALDVENSGYFGVAYRVVP